MLSAATNVIRVGQIEIRYLLEGADTAESLAMFECLVPSRARVPLAHSHDAYDETIYGVEGATTFTLDGRACRVAPGESLFIPRGAVHRFENPEEAHAKFLAVITPGILSSNFFREIAAIIDSAAGGPPSVAAIADVMRRHGLTPAP
jgi:quercetin dioxygenase-like cupin family protein